MIRSMTGFGRGSAQTDAAEATVEVRSVNGRFMEVSVRSPRELNGLDNAIQSRCKDVLSRGNVSVNISLNRTNVDPAQTVDHRRVEAVIAMLRELGSAANLGDGTVTLDHLLRYPDIFTTVELDANQAEGILWSAVEPALDLALAEIDQMRKQEGHTLENDLKERINTIDGLLSRVESLAPDRVTELQNKLLSRVEELLADERISSDRLETEVALIADKLDVTEECVRLHSHIGQFREALEESEPVGRRLNFIAQEFNREVNTIASKANDAEIAQLAVRMKEELEKIREQVQNIV